MALKILLLGRKGILVEEAKAAINDPNIEIFAGTNIDDVRSVLASTRIDHVFSGAGIDLDKRLEIIKEIFETSQVTNVHLKDASSGPKGFIPFVKAILEGLNGAESQGMTV